MAKSSSDHGLAPASLAAVRERLPPALQKEQARRQAVAKKVAQILENPLHYKPLRGPLKGVRRVHITGSFVLLFETNDQNAIVRLLRLAHHDEAYQT